MLDQVVVDAEKYMEEMTLLEKLRFILTKKTLGQIPSYESDKSSIMKT